MLHAPLSDPAIEKLQATVAHLVQTVEHRADNSAVHDELRALKLHVAKMEHKHARLAKKQQQRQQQSQQDPPFEPSSRPNSAATPALQDLVQFELEVRRLQTAEAEHARQIRALMAELDAERARNVTLSKVKVALEEQVRVARATGEALEVRAKEAEGRAEAAQRQVNAWQRRVAALEAKSVKGAKKWGKERDLYRTKLIEAKDQIMELRGAVQDLARDLTGMRDQVHAQEAVFQSKIADAIQKRTERAHQTETHLAQSHAAALHDLQNQLAAARQAQAAAESQAAQALAHAAARTQTLEADAARSAARAEAADSVTRTVESHLQQARAELDSRTHERDEALRVVAAQRNQLRALAVQVRDLEHLYEAKVTKYRAKVASVVPGLKGEVERLTKEAELKSAELAAAHDKVLELRAAVKAAEERASKAETQLERVRKDVDALKPAIAVKDKMLADQAESMKQVKTHLAAKVAEFQDVQRKLDGLKELEYELQRRDADIDRLEDLADAYRAERNDARDLAADLQQRLDDRNSAIQHIEAEAAKIQAQIAKAEADARSAVAARDLVVDELKRVVEASRHAQTEAEHARDAALAEAAELRAAIHDVQAQCEALVRDRDVAVRKVRAQYAEVERRWQQVSAAFGSALGPRRSTMAPRTKKMKTCTNLDMPGSCGKTDSQVVQPSTSSRRFLWPSRALR
ncbi:hypothetical protein AMAG_20406 [Allomyces macrogynus ATCC 38327]|uniref:Uncharacterized protein n=1 Tax=Allomyces macrogynus (strain ATCC 38327) TaxID=578462 RepID=A0A0L0T8T7_ALLM3|nr:hypothetical protein AMAG_20406 [Allomyces macrogynus ATCC 38327]|eukprot:KNE71167.1 hypothetical protein AMAG_20406 [Allomyces macrogynus ATCC 38327]